MRSACGWVILLGAWALSMILMGAGGSQRAAAAAQAGMWTALHALSAPRHAMVERR